MTLGSFCQQLNIIVMRCNAELCRRFVFELTVRADFEDPDVRANVELHGSEPEGVRQLDETRPGQSVGRQLRVPAGEHDERVRDTTQL